MLSFHYVAINPQREQLSGVIEAENEVEARKKLNDLGFSIVTIEEVAKAAHEASTKPIFEFEAFDKNGKKIVGTVVADDSLSAFVRLFEAYKLNVLYVTDSKASEEEKQKARVQGIGALQTQYEKTRVNIPGAVAGDGTSNVDEKERVILVKQVDDTMKRITAFLSQYTNDIKIEERDAIQSYLNQLSRIKDSSNLEHIRSTCERMLEHIQKQELFLNEKEKRKVSMSLKLQTHNLLDQLKSTGLQKDISLSDFAKKLESKPFLEPIAKLFSKYFVESNPAIVSLNDQIRAVNKNISTYIKVLFSGGKGMRHEAWESIKVLRGEKKRLLVARDGLRQQDKKVSVAEGTIEHGIVYDLSAWILAFYLFGYFATYPFTVKEITHAVPKTFFFYSSVITNDLVIGIFFLFCIQRITSLFMKSDQHIARISTYIFGTLCYIFLSINLL